MATPETSVRSSSEVNSPVSIKLTKGSTVEELDEIMKNLDLEEFSSFSDTVFGGKFGNISEKDFITRCGDFSRNFKDTWRLGLILHGDEHIRLHLDPSQCTSNRHQVYIIINDTSEEVDDENNPVINPHNLERGVNHRADGEIVSGSR
jgi:hypothetical protein